MTYGLHAVHIRCPSLPTPTPDPWTAMTLRPLKPLALAFAITVAIAACQKTEAPAEAPVTAAAEVGPLKVDLSKVEAPAISLQASDIELAFELKRRTDVVERTVRLPLTEKPQPLLGERLRKGRRLPAARESGNGVLVSSLSSVIVAQNSLADYTATC